VVKIAATFTRGGVETPAERLSLTNEFTDDPQEKIRWAAFVRRTRRAELADVSAIVATLDRFSGGHCFKRSRGANHGPYMVE